MTIRPSRLGPASAVQRGRHLCPAYGRIRVGDPAAFAGASFFVAIAVLTFTDRTFPPWSGCLAVIGAIANVGAVGGIFALRGPLNSGNGLIGGIAARLGLDLMSILAISVWWLRHDSTAGSVRDRIGVG